MKVPEAIVYVRRNGEKPVPIEFLGRGVYSFGRDAMAECRKYDEARYVIGKHKWLNAFLKYIEWF